jgi:3-carboxy-cis,cis-muconate cycloisomerase
MAASLGLRDAAPWHALRDGVVEHGQVMALIAGTLGKMGQDLALMAQQGVDEVALSGGGGSSAMPHKANPVAAETLVALARYAAGQSGLMAQALVHEQERSGAAWTLEWMVLPGLSRAALRALGLAADLVARVERIGAPGSKDGQVG